jgi:hypothetical protein
MAGWFLGVFTRHAAAENGAERRGNARFGPRALRAPPAAEMGARGDGVFTW